MQNQINNYFQFCTELTIGIIKGTANKLINDDIYSLYEQEGFISTIEKITILTTAFFAIAHLSQHLNHLLIRHRDYPLNLHFIFLVGTLVRISTYLDYQSSRYFEITEPSSKKIQQLVNTYLITYAMICWYQNHSPRTPLIIFGGISFGVAWVKLLH